ncbi:hypothetical protein K1719_001980 [Acacia pycnantha]|nr:hypothetical protein K1719_001980 [Acacia pycnantha]
MLSLLMELCLGMGSNKLQRKGVLVVTISFDIALEVIALLDLFSYSYPIFASLRAYLISSDSSGSRGAKP